MEKYRLGLDVGSTTVKVVLLNEEDEIIYSRYRRHKADVRGELLLLMEETAKECGDIEVSGVITGSGGLAVAGLVDLPFMQEVVTETEATEHFLPQTDVILELGGEDAKITYMKPSLEQRMNGTCAGGTGAFIDQMASLLDTDAQGLNELAKKGKTIYPIAARCGVFAKTDVQPLLNDGANREDVALSIFQAVVNQTISGLACGRPVRGHVAFLGGPLHYLSELRKRFVETLGLTDEEALCPENGHLFVAAGGALLADGGLVPLKALPERMRRHTAADHETRRLTPLFSDAEELAAFREAHSTDTAGRVSLCDAQGPLYIGLDAGSTTIKAILMDEEERIVYRFYEPNRGRVLDTVRHILRDIYANLPESAWIASSCATGYGERIVREAFHFDEGEVETVAHYRAARRFCPDVEFIIDIGGQDMKCMRIRNGALEDIMLNEACSSGCGSFLETFANSLDTSIQDFAESALLAEHPVDLGTRCTVFMNSRVKQAQKEGAGVADISSGLAYSVVKNALYKVIKVKDPADLGARVVCQGGTFQNDAVLRAFELELGRSVVRPDIAECMGAYGAALLARDRVGAATSTITPEELESFSASGRSVRCGKCSNQCMLTVTTFGNGEKFITGNRCERGSGRTRPSDRINLAAERLERVFGYTPLSAENAPRGEIGIPRALNMYEDYPFWFTILTKLGFRVVLSEQTSHETFMRGIETIPSESVCYPAKLVHGHVANLVDQGVRRILYPCVPYEEKEYEGSNNHYNCPIVTSYPEVIRHNMDEVGRTDVEFLHFFVALDDRKAAEKTLARELKRFGIPENEIHAAVRAGFEEFDVFHEDLRRRGEETIAALEQEGRTGIVLSGRPYHLDPEISHGLPALLTSFGFDVLTESNVAHLGKLERPIRVLDQWAYHTRVYEAAAAVAKHDCLQMISLNSFGCGLDAIVLDQAREIVEASGKVYTVLKMDEISNMGAVTIRLRSLQAALSERASMEPPQKKSAVYERRMFTKAMRENGTVVCPQLAPLQFQFLKEAFEPAGYHFDVLTEVSKQDIDVGLKYVNNDACYPTIIVVGQLVNAFLEGRLDPDTTTIMLTQTGGGCRASNYIAFLRKALAEAGYPQVVVASINFAGMEKNPGFRFTGGLALRLLISMSLGDLLQKLVLGTRPYEKNAGQTNALFEKWVERVKEITRAGKYLEYRKAVREMVEEFDSVERTGEVKPKVGLVGEILVKYHPDANNHAVDVIESEGGECILPALMDFMTYGLHSSGYAKRQMGRSAALAAAGRFGINLMDGFRKPVRAALEKSRNFERYPTIDELAEEAHEVLCEGHCTGEGWFLTAEMLHLIHEGAPNIICVQPFACLPNHVVGKGMIRAVRSRYPEANIVAIDYDPGASEVNQLNRIKLMMHTAFANLGRKREASGAENAQADVKTLKDGLHDAVADGGA